MRIRSFQALGWIGISLLGISSMLASCGKGSAQDIAGDDSFLEGENSLTDQLVRPEDSLRIWQERFGVSGGVPGSSAEIPVSSGGTPVSSAVVPISSGIVVSSSSAMVPPPSSGTVGSSSGALVSSSAGLPVSSSTVVLPSSSAALPSSSAALPSSSAALPSSSAALPSSSAGGGGTALSFTYGGTAQALTPGTAYSISFAEVRGKFVCMGSGSITATIGADTKTVDVSAWTTEIIAVTQLTGTATAAAGSSMTCKQDW